MSNVRSEDSSIPTPTECQRIRERAQLVLARARILGERLDQSGGLLGFALQTRAAQCELVPQLYGGRIQASPARA